MKRFIQLLLIAILFELMLGGGGRLTAWGPISLRMILFAIALVTVAVQVLRLEKISRQYWFLILLFCALILVGMAKGISLGANRVYWWEDIKPLMYFLILPFFGFAIRDRNTVDQLTRIVIQSGIILSGAFIFLLVLIHSSIIPFQTFYSAVIGTEEFFFRGELTFFYKGFIYICIALLFVYLKRHENKWMMLLLMAAILLSVTRGFLFALALTYGCYFLIKKSRLKSIVFGCIAAAILVIGGLAISTSSEIYSSLGRSQQHQQEEIKPDSNLFGDKNYSDAGRLNQIKEVVQRIDLISAFIGHGFGNGIPSRPVHMEISYLEIFHKQGLLGLAFWFYLLAILFQKYKAAAPGDLSNCYFFGALFIYFQSLTNQFMNNPIGLSMILLSLICLDQLKNANTRISLDRPQEYHPF